MDMKVPRTIVAPRSMGCHREVQQTATLEGNRLSAIAMAT
jgi:hypothetical protein